MKYQLRDLIDIEQFQSLQNRLTEIYSFPSALIENDGTVLTASAWQEVCTKFHRKHPDCERECIKSDQYAVNHLHEAKPAVIYRCPHGLVDNAVPIIIDGVHYGNFFTGQFFLEKPDLDFFRAQARRFGFDENEYMAAVAKVPIWNQEQLSSYLLFIQGLVEVIAFTGLTNLRNLEAKIQLQESAQLRQQIINSANEGIIVYGRDLRYLVWNPFMEKMSGVRTNEVLGKHPLEVFPFLKDSGVIERLELALSGAVPDPVEFQYKHNGNCGWIIDRSAPLRDAAGGIVGVIATVQEITQRKVAELAQQKSDDYLRLAVDGGNVGLWEWNLATNELAWSERSKCIFGLPINTTGLTFEKFTSAIHLDDVEDTTRRVRAALDENREFRHEYRIVWPDRSVHWIEAIGRGVRDEVGNLVRMTGAALDVTERKRTEVLMRARAELAEIAARGTLENLLQAALDRAEMLTDSCIGFFHFIEDDQEHLKLQVWSTKTLNSMCTAETKGRHYPVSEAGVWVDCVRERRPVIHNDYASLAHKKGLPAGHAPVVREIVVPFIRNNLVVCVLGVGNKPTPYTEQDLRLLEDLTSLVGDHAIRLRAEEAHAQLATAVEQAGEAIVITDTQGTILYVNPAFEETSGYTRKEALGQNPRVLKSGRHDAEYYRQMWSTLLQGQVWKGQLINRRKDGTLYEELATISPVRDNTGKLINYVSVKRDVTREVQLESQLLQAQKMEAIGTLASGIAHDLNNVLAPMLMVSGLLRSKLTDGEDRNLLEMLHQEAKRGGNIIKQLLVFSRGLEGDRVLVHPWYALRELINLIRETFPREIEIHHHCDRKVWPIMADQTQFHQLLLNLCVNARDAMPKGGTLAVVLRNVMLTATDPVMPPGAVAGAYLLIEVKDTGHGIPAEIRNRIFDPFFTTKPIGKGTGLGLATVHGIARNHGGFVTVESEVGRGSSFSTFWPAVPEEVISESAEPEAAVPRGHGQLILVVDDEQNIRAAARLVLERQNYLVQTAVNGDDALAQYRRNREKISLVITDIMMPGMNGVELAVALRRENPNLPIIATSGLCDIDSHREMIAMGVPDVVTKPFTPHTLLQVVHRRLAQPH